MKKKSLSLISDFNVEPLSRLFNKNNFFKINKFFYSSIFDQLNTSYKTDIILVWIDCKNVFSEVNNYYKSGKINYKKLQNEIKSFCKYIKLLNKNSKIIINTFIDHEDNLNAIDFLYRNNKSSSYLFNYINNKVVDNLSNSNNIHIIDLNKLIIEFKNQYNDIAYYYSTKSRFNIPFYNYYSKFILNFILNLYKIPKKILILDLDDTLWGEEIAEVGINNINLGGNNYLGEAFVNFQRSILKLKKQGILIGIVSKNDEKVALNALKSHPEMILKFKDFSSIKINWNNKVNNLIEISQELNLGLESFVFFDNSKFERDNVLEHLPEILVPDLSLGPTTYNSILCTLKCFDLRNNSQEDLVRTKYYLQNQKRDRYFKKSVNREEWIKNLKIVLKIKKYKKINLNRILQLINKTNQMNLSTNRYTEKEFNNFLLNKNVRMHSLNVSDKFGDYGLTGLISFVEKNNYFQVVDFIFSCRIMARDIENIFVKNILKIYLKKNKKFLFVYKKTQKNEPMFRFLKNSGLFKLEKSNKFIFPEDI